MLRHGLAQNMIWKEVPVVTCTSAPTSHLEPVPHRQTTRLKHKTEAVPGHHSTRSTRSTAAAEHDNNGSAILPQRLRFVESDQCSQPRASCHRVGKEEGKCSPAIHSDHHHSFRSKQCQSYQALL